MLIHFSGISHGKCNEKLASVRFLMDFYRIFDEANDFCVEILTSKMCQQQAIDKPVTFE